MHGGGHAPHPQFQFLVVACVAQGAHRRQLALQPRQIGDAVARVADQTRTGRIGAYPGGVVVREEQLAHGGQVQWRSAADGSDDLHARTLTVAALDVHDLVALPHRQVHGLLGEPVQFPHRTDGRLAHVEPRLDQVAKFEQAHAKPVASHLGPVHQPPVRQIVEDPMGRGGAARCAR